MLRLISDANIPVTDLGIIAEDEDVGESSSEEQDLLRKKISGNQLNGGICEEKIIVCL